jgi:hypothetical protein
MLLLSLKFSLTPRGVKLMIAPNSRIRPCKQIIKEGQAKCAGLQLRNCWQLQRTASHAPMYAANAQVGQEKRPNLGHSERRHQSDVVGRAVRNQLVAGHCRRRSEHSTTHIQSVSERAGESMDASCGAESEREKRDSGGWSIDKNQRQKKARQERVECECTGRTGGLHVQLRAHGVDLLDYRQQNLPANDTRGNESQQHPTAVRLLLGSAE